MQIKSVLAGAAISLAASIGTASAGEQFTYLEDVKAISMNNTQMDKVTAANLVLPNGKVILGDPGDFDNPAPGEFHPSFAISDGGRRSDTAQAATTGHGPSVSGFGNEGPWSATVVSPVISICTNVIPGFPAC